VGERLHFCARVGGSRQEGRSYQVHPILTGITVIDMTVGLAGPMATRLLADAGADVVKVESPSGDLVKGSPLYIVCNRGKRRITLDLDKSTERAVFDDMLASADVFTHSLRRSEALEWHLDDQALRTRFPRLIVCTLRGFPDEHLDFDMPGFDILIQAATGLMDEQERTRPGPIFSRLPSPSWCSVYLVAIGIIVRLLIRQRGGSGGAVHTSLFQGGMIPLLGMWNRVKNPTDSMSMKPDSERMLFRCGDGAWIQLSGYWAEVPLLLETMATAGLEPPEQSDSSSDRSALSRAEEDALWRSVFSQHPSEDWLLAMEEFGVPAARVAPLGELLRSSEAVTHGYVVEVEDPVWGLTRQAGTPFQIRTMAASQDGLSPMATVGRLGAHPLEGLRVLDFGTFIAGPFCAMLLSDLGADVIKVESLTGDRIRVWENLFLGYQRGKRSIAIDLRKSDAHPILERLVQWADVVHHNLRSSKARKLGLDCASIRLMNPNAIYSQIYAYGPTGPNSDHPGMDPVMQAMSGWMVEGAGDGNTPFLSRHLPIDTTAGLASTVATLLALYHRERTGSPSEVSASLVGAAAMMTSETVLQMATGTVAPVHRVDSALTGVSEGYRIYQALDGWIAVAAVSPCAMAAARTVLGLARSRNDGEGTFKSAIAKRHVGELMDAFRSVEVPAQPVRENYKEEFFNSADQDGSKLVTTYPSGRYGVVQQAGAFWAFDGFRVQLEKAAPALGEHSREILREMGVDDYTILSLGAAGVVSGANLL
jgi:crotonobetainyl-CoA:carnitine CoA-transferase CaiB-like acyl-CoA transferase